MRGLATLLCCPIATESRARSKDSPWTLLAQIECGAAEPGPYLMICIAILALLHRLALWAALHRTGPRIPLSVIDKPSGPRPRAPINVTPPTRTSQLVQHLCRTDRTNSVQTVFQSKVLATPTMSTSLASISLARPSPQRSAARLSGHRSVGRPPNTLGTRLFAAAIATATAKRTGTSWATRVAAGPSGQRQTLSPTSRIPMNRCRPPRDPVATSALCLAKWRISLQ